VDAQVEVLSLMGDIATFDGKPSVHMHTILGRRDGSTIGGHIWRLVANPTLEVFMTVNRAPLVKKPDPASGMRLIDPTR
jgi:predicted DNA-binding protein with PD1-like motif